MCFPYDALPPIPPIAGAAVDSQDLTLRAEDGNSFAGFVARVPNGGRAGVVILPDVRGLFRFYEELALRFAEEGITAITFDYYGRTAGVAKREADFPFMDHVRQTPTAAVASDVASCVQYLRSPEGGSCQSVFTLGFCFGGAHSWLQTANGFSLAGAVGFYGRPGPGFDGSPGPAQRAGDFAAPILALMGGGDQMIPPEQVEELRAALKDSGVEHEVVVYPGAPHSFFDRTFEQYASESADAWQRVIGFIRGHV